MVADTQTETRVSLEEILKAKVRLKGVADHTPLTYNRNLSEKYDCHIFLKREDLQVVRSYKIRGAYNKMASMDPATLAKGVICASAGNHAQGVAFACLKLKVKGKIYMPSVTPRQKIDKVRFFGKENVEIVLIGDTFDDASAEARKDAELNGITYIHPFNDLKVIEGQGTVGLEILEDCDRPIDYVFGAIGGGGLISGVGSYIKALSPNTKIIGVEPVGAPGMYESLKAGEVITLEHIDNFVDGAAVRRVGDIPFRIVQSVVDDILLVPEGKVCTHILRLYNEEGIVAEPAGALSIAALDLMCDAIKGKTVVCIVGGSNNDITRTEEIKERSLLFEGLKHYFVLRFPQRPGALRDFVNNVLGPDDDITHFEYIKKHSRETGPAMIGIQLSKKEDYEGLLQRMTEKRFHYQTLNDNQMLFDLLV